MDFYDLVILLATAMVLAACGRSDSGAGADSTYVDADTAAVAVPGAATRTFAEDLALLQVHAPVQVLKGVGGARVALSAAYQGRVMTSAARPEGHSFGWINREFIEDGTTGTQFDNYGGEDRFWLGPEGGQYSLYFPPDSAFGFSSWQVPEALNEGAWTIREQSDTSATFTRSMHLVNYSGTRFEMQVERTVRLLSWDEAADHMHIEIPEELEWVGFETINRVTNIGERAWEKDDGVPSIWILGMYEPFGTTYVVLPFEGENDGEVVNDAYFGEVPPERLAVRDGYILFKCDGEFRSKIGLGPTRAKSVLGSYNEDEHLLTLVQYNKPADTQEYVNSMWEIQEEPYAGDAVNSYNDGPPEPGVPPLGGFYEIESSSPALQLAPGESYVHIQRTLHLIGDDTATLEPVAQGALGISLSTIAEGIQ
jgi:hypothetical protein